MHCRANAQQPKLFVGMILILIFAEALALYGLIGAAPAPAHLCLCKLLSQHVQDCGTHGCVMPCTQGSCAQVLDPVVLISLYADRWLQ